MNFWKDKNLFPVLAVFFLLGLLVLLAGLQYKWLGQISDAEREHLQSRLQDDTKRFAEDFNREIQSVYFSFQINAEDFRTQNWNSFNKQLVNWKNQTQFPGLVNDFYLIKKEDAQTLLKFDVKKNTFEKSDWTNELTNINQTLNDENQFNPVLEKQGALAIPIVEKDDGFKQIIIRRTVNDAKNIQTESKIQMPSKYGFLIVFLNEDVLKNQLISGLARKYFSNSEGSDYKVSITNDENQIIFQTQSERITSPDSEIKFFSLKPNGFSFFRENSENILSNSQVKAENTFIYNGKISPKTVSSNKNEILTVDIKNIEQGKSGVTIFEGKNTGKDGIWTLDIQYSDGSLEQFITNSRRRNLAVSFGILSLLAASVVLIFGSAQRSKRLAQRQLDFVSSVSHEFRTPLAVIYSAGENLTDGVVNSQTQISTYGSLIKGEGKKLTVMVEQILEFAGARSGKRKYDFRLMSVKEIIENAISECQPLIEEKEFVLEKDFLEKLPEISADSNALSHAIQNLILNSIKYSSGSRWLKITAKNGGTNLKISVEDKGIGISKKDLTQIFEPFYRSKSVIDEQIHGNGLGLSLVKQIVEAHKGKITVESEIEKGSKFTVHLPVNN